MVLTYILLISVILSFGVFFIPKSLKYYFTLAILGAGIAATTYWAILLYVQDSGADDIRIAIPLLQRSFPLVIDRLSAFFILVINITSLVGFLYAKGYLKPYYHEKNALRFSIHYFSYLWLYLSMIFVVTIRDGLFFLIAWELMAVSSFLLVIFEAEERVILKTGINYLIQMHAGMFFILTGFLLVSRYTGQMSFDALKDYFSGNPNFPLFLLFFAGFGIKAGFIPLHTWLPDAHPAAPSHVSGVMSGVMIKMGIYGIIRVLAALQSDLLITGIFILAVSVISGLFGVMMAIMQHDIKRLLAYHSIENIGIIGIGLGLGVIGLSTGNTVLSLLGFGGGLLHVMNHSLFKSMLFFNAGSVYTVTHTRNIEKLGGLMKKMPYTAGLFLIGSLAICGLPPFNGFISEYLIYAGIFTSLPSADLIHSIMFLLVITGLVLIGGLAIFCFTKAFGIVFLGQPRTGEAESAGEVSRSMLVPQLLTLFFILLIGFGSFLVVKPLFETVRVSFNLPGTDLAGSGYLTNLAGISLLGGIFVLITVALLVYRRYHLKSRMVTTGPTWGCGYTAVNARQQYTATSYSYNYNHLAKPLLQTRKVMKEIGEEEIFPGKRAFKSRSEDILKKILIDIPVDWISALLKKIAVMQTGQIRHYILYAFIFMLVIFLLTCLKLI
jgi:hydrogenase-4 component B